MLKQLSKLVGASVGIAMLSANAFADISITLNGGSGAVGGTVSMTYDYSALDADDVGGFQFDIMYDPASLTPSDFANCGQNAPATHSGFCTEPNGADGGLVRVFLSDGIPPTDEVSPTAIAALGAIEFTIDQSGTHSLVFTDPVGSDTGGGNVPMTGSDTSITGSIVGAAGFASSPPPNSSIGLGPGEVNTASSGSPAIITVSEIGDQALEVTAITFSGANSSAFSTTTAPFTIADGGADVGVDVTCTPDARGDLFATLQLPNNSVNEDAPVYDLNCTGLSPNVAVSDNTVTITGSTADASFPTGSFDITNVQDGFASDALNASLAEGAVAEISIDQGLDDGTISVNETDTVTLECDNTAAGNFSETITLTYDDPVAAGSIEVMVDCEITDVAPGYSSNPAVPGPLAFGTVENGQSATLTIDIGNENSIGTDPGADLEITGVSLSDPTNYSFSPDPFTATLGDGAPNGTESLDVSCNPQSIGDFSGATVAVQTNDGDQVYNLECEGTSNAELVVTPASARDGVLNLGTVTPGTPTSGGLTLSNAGTDSLEVDCTLTNANGGVIVFDPMPSFPVTLPPDETLTFTGTPPDVANYSETLECSATEPGNSTQPPTTFTTEITVSGRPLVIPTMSGWGLVVMSLMLMLVAGFAGRRMMA